jgi:hypothetical protein
MTEGAKEINHKAPQVVRIVTGGHYISVKPLLGRWHNMTQTAQYQALARGWRKPG